MSKTANLENKDAKENMVIKSKIERDNCPE